LVNDGHTRIGFISGPRSVSTGRDRRLGFEQALRDAGLPVSRRLIRAGDFRYASGKREAEALVGLQHPPSAIVVGNNLMTMGALAAIHNAGLRIPEDIAIVGFDDVPWASELDPPLTTVAQPTREEGRTAAELLMRRIDGGDEPTKSVLLAADLVVRSSCARHSLSVDSHDGSVVAPYQPVMSLSGTDRRRTAREREVRSRTA
jgi:DNA-binding LacI/PurR family transcriptional regulator